MKLDLDILEKGLKKLSDLKNIYSSHVRDYIEGFLYPHDELSDWIKKYYPSYTISQLSTLVLVGPGINIKGFKKLFLNFR
jgi:hypothetical protein